MQRIILIFTSIWALISLACTITIPEVKIKTLQTTVPQTFEVNEPVPAGHDSARLEIRMGAGKLQLSGGAKGLVQGSILYNVEDWKPEIVRSGDLVMIRQETSVTGGSGQDIINEWNLKLGSTPLDLEINAGAYEGKLDLSGVPLKNLTINDGASSSRVGFDQPNPVVMKKLSYKTGASNVELDGLANANFEQMSFEGGAGSFRLNFSGDLQRNAAVHIRGGVSELKIRVPQNTACAVKVNGSLSNVRTDGNWSSENNTYTNPGEGPMLSIEVELGVGSLELIQD